MGLHNLFTHSVYVICSWEGQLIHAFGLWRVSKVSGKGDVSWREGSLAPYPRLERPVQQNGMKFEKK